MSSGRPPKRPRSPFGERLSAARQASGLSQSEVAQRLGITQHAYARWERKPVALRPDQLVQVAGILGTSVGELVGETPIKPETSISVGRGRRLFEQIANLPPPKQKRMFKVIALILEG